ncbi:MAG: ATP-dependent Clp protease adapter ClpS [Mariprofundaceae bacterium]
MGHFDAGTIIRNPEEKTEKAALKPPPLYRVIMLNDDFTPMDFVVGVLMRIFHKDFAEATRLMMQVHEKGCAVCGVYPREIAETRMMRAMQAAREAGHPLRCAMEPDEAD